MKKNIISLIVVFCLAVALAVPLCMQMCLHNQISQTVVCQEKINQLVGWSLYGFPYKVHACVGQFSNAQKRLVTANLKTMLGWFYANYGGEDQIKRMLSKQENREFWANAVAIVGGVGAALLGGSHASEKKAPAASVATVGGLGGALVGSAIADNATLQAEDIKIVLACVQSIEQVLAIVESSYRPGMLEKAYNKVVAFCSGLYSKANKKATVCALQLSSVAVGKKNSVVKAIRTIKPSMSVKEVKDLMGKVPVILQEHVPENDACERKQLLEKAGAVITLVYQ